MIFEIAYYSFLGAPLIMWGGLTTFVCMAITMALSKKNRTWHIRFGIASFILAIGHGGLGLFLYLS